MDSGDTVWAVVVPALALAVVSAPMAVVWFAVVSLSRADRATRTDVIGGFGYGLLAAGAATALGLAAELVGDLTEAQRLTIVVPVVEEALKALAVVLAIGAAAVIRGDRLALRRCAIATVSVAAAFAVAENVGYLATLFLEGGGSFGDAGAVIDTLRVRAFLPPLAHVAESGAVGAAIWLASRPRRPYRRTALLMAGLGVAIAVHAGWNAATLRWWPDPRPLLAILAGATVAAVACCLAATPRGIRWRSGRPGPGGWRS
jgi:RsiW-degrading membrane proteinase PrsW (M82 family)